MRRCKFGILVTMLATVVGGCGGGGTFANKPRPPTPVNLTVYVDNSRVAVSPTSVGAGLVVFIVTNSADKTESVNIVNRDGAGIGTTGPINPQATAQVTVDFRDPGEYVVSTGTSAATEAQQHQKIAIRPARIHIGSQRPSSSNQLLQP
jgi:hypothetical protein